jgi:hypothetical protein
MNYHLLTITIQLMKKQEEMLQLLALAMEAEISLIELLMHLAQEIIKHLQRLEKVQSM